MALPTSGAHHAILPGYRPRHTNWGTQELVELLTFAARRVFEKHPGALLRVGNLSFRRGGDISWSVSHNAGRDADLAFYVTRRGHPEPAPSLVRVNADLRSRSPAGYRLDLARNWTLVESLLSHPRIPVQWIFVAKPVREALLGYARRRGVGSAMLGKAEQTLRQPTDSLSHDDHFHVRIYCSLEDRLGGCTNRGPLRPGVKDHARAVSARIRMLLPGLSDPAHAIRGRVIALLGRLEARREVLFLARALRTETDPDNQSAIVALIARWAATGPEVQTELGRFLGRTDLGRRAPIRQVYALLGKGRSAPLLGVIRRGLTSDRVLPRSGRAPEATEAELAAHAALALLDRRLVPALIGALDSPRGAVRQAAVEALRRTTNHSFGLRWTGVLPPTRRHKQIARWKGFWDRHGALSREALVIRGFRQRRARWKGLGHPSTLRYLVALTQGSDHLAYNAHWLLARQAGLPRDARAAKSPAARHAAWQRWYRVRFPPPRPKRRSGRRALARRQRPRGTLAVVRTPPPPARRPAPRRAVRQRPVRAPR